MRATKLPAVMPGASDVMLILAMRPLEFDPTS
jgi:hypothetical protein